MARSFNNSDPKPFTTEKIVGVGNATRDPRQISGNGKMTVAVVSVAANSRSIDKDGEVVEHAVFRELKLFGRDADAALANVSKGTRIKYEGRLSPVQFVNRDDEEVTQYEVLVDYDGLTLVPTTGESGKSTRSRRNADEDEAPTRSRSRSRSRKRDEEDDYDNDDDYDGDVDLEDDEDEAPRRSTRSRKAAPAKRSRSRKQVDNDLDDDYTDKII